VTDILAPSSWSITEARGMVADLRHEVSGDDYDVLELFGALCEHLDQLYGGFGFDRLFPPPARAEVAGLVAKIRGGVPTGAPTLDDDGRPVDFGNPGTDRYLDGVIRLDQPVNSALTLAEGRHAAARLAAVGDWRSEIGRALQGLYAYLDELYGGPGAFDELLNSEDRRKVAGLVQGLPR
jgi:hypothetical protein